ncbi:larval cuticle protein LCP-17-like [Aricia agestis]|uniref:larval cuticle protein LCP-17-like n=1 Tax=Aricia agestis TaxID=91739 RepID=UPI001C20259D|nr:larval cuticle protein LCP-17-like [Aricia agestis]
MKFFAVLAVIVASAIAAEVPVYRSVEADAPILRYDNEAAPDGSSFHNAIETGNGIAQQSEGVLKNVNSEYPALEVRGSVSYTSPEGVPVRLTWVANEDGYRAEGDSIPVAPPVPELILRSLEYIRNHPAPAPVEYLVKKN